MGACNKLTDRSQQIRAFLTQTDWADAILVPLAGDASNRRYERLTNPDGTTAVLMNAPPDSGENIRGFVDIAQHLTRHDLSAPLIFAQDFNTGFLLIEDLGDALFTRVIAADPQAETSLYRSACDLLIQLHQIECPPLTAFDPPMMAEQAGLVFTSYQQGITGKPIPEAATKFRSEMLTLLTKHTQCNPVMILRDFHAENLLWLPSRVGVARVGLLDFQDAVTGHPVYDLVSMLQDIRRNVSKITEKAIIRHYVEHTNTDEQQFHATYAVLGVQRNLRILGVFSRLATDYGKRQYIDLIPRVWDHVIHGLQHPELRRLADILIPNLPEPTSKNLHHLRAS